MSSTNLRWMICSAADAAIGAVDDRVPSCYLNEVLVLMIAVLHETAVLMIAPIVWILRTMNRITDTHDPLLPELQSLFCAWSLAIWMFKYGKLLPARYQDPFLVFMVTPDHSEYWIMGLTAVCAAHLIGLILDAIPLRLILLSMEAMLWAYISFSKLQETPPLMGSVFVTWLTVFSALGIVILARQWGTRNGVHCG